PEVADVVVVVVPRAGHDGAERELALVAYVVPTERHDERALRAFVRERLPEFLVPSVFVTVAALPTNVSGKVDHGALPDPWRHQPDVRLVAPRSATERAVAHMWCEVLGVDVVGVGDNFVDLGGDSLRVARLRVLIRDRLGVDVNLGELFGAADLEAVGALVDDRLAAGGDPRVARGRGPLPLPRDGYPLSFVQERLWALWRRRPDDPSYNVPVAFRLHGPVEVDALSVALSGVIRRHEALRTRFLEFDGEPRQIVTDPRPEAVECVDLSDVADEDRHVELDALLTGAAERSFDLTRDLLLRAWLIRLAPEDHVLAITCHHIAVDGVSLRLILSELSAAYTGGTPSEPPLQYGDFAFWERTQGDQDAIDAQLAECRDRLHALPVLRLPADRRRTGEPSSRAGLVEFTVPRSCAERLEAVGRAEWVTLYVTLVAAYQAVLARLSGQTDFAVGTGASTRSHEGLDRVVGCFVNTIVLRADCAGNPTFRQLLTRVGDQAALAHAQHDVPFDQLVAEVRQDREPTDRPVVTTTIMISPQWSFLSMDLSMNLRPRVPVEAFNRELVHADAHVAYSCRVNSKSHNPSGRGFDPHPPHLSSKNAPR
ncbi:MAG TPA: condensation domain-containing protein, partial [Pseudonocardiaceae bacterium]|nr:condensation domain-containing protein [Pseudonocardiaceae bacterium]